MAGLAGEDYEFGLVGFETLNIQLLALFTQVAATMVDADSNGAGLLATNSSILELREREATALAELAIVTNSLGTDGGAKGVQRADTESGSLGLAGCASARLATRLVEPSADTTLPVFPEVVVVKH